jgi:hypothetical protein
METGCPRSVGLSPVKGLRGFNQLLFLFWFEHVASVGSNPFESGLQLLMVKLRIKAGLSNRVYHFTTLSSKASQLVVVDVQPVHLRFIHFDVPSLMKKFED